jgi:two-component system sensor histidine kinase YesM
MSVNDNGPGFREGDVPAPVRGRGGYGLVNIRQRLEGYFGAAATLSVDCSPGTTTVSITLPLLRQEPRPQQPERIAR